jgi:hypothetical protein
MSDDERETKPFKFVTGKSIPTYPRPAKRLICSYYATMADLVEPLAGKENLPPSSLRSETTATTSRRLNSSRPASMRR